MRFFRWWSAFFGRYFWLPCRGCGQNFGGNEPGTGFVDFADGSGEMTCPRCALVAESHASTKENLSVSFREAPRHYRGGSRDDDSATFRKG